MMVDDSDDEERRYDFNKLVKVMQLVRVKRMMMMNNLL